MLKGLIRGKSQSHQAGAGQPGAHQPGGHQPATRPPRLLGDLDMRIAADGTWFYQGAPINRMPLVKLFAAVLRREEDGEYWLVTPAERGRIQVEDAPFTAVEVTAEGRGPSQRLIFRTNLDEIVALDETHPLQSRGSGRGSEEVPRPYILIRDRLEARILRSVYYHLVELGKQQGDQFGVWSSGRFFPLGSVTPAP
jgi:uncharacterized protein